MFTGFPTSVGSTDYGILSYQPTPRDIVSYNYLTVTSLGDNTHVYISNFSRNAYNVSLSYMESYTLRTREDSSGARVKSDKPVNVVAGSSCSDIPVGTKYCDAIYDSPLPMQFWGQNFIIPPLMPKKGYIVRVLAKTNASVVSLEYRTVYTTLQTVVFTCMHELQFGMSAAVIRANETVTIVQYSLSKTFDNINGDPFMTSLPSLSHFSNNYTFPSPLADKGFTNRIAVTVESKYVNELKLDGSSVTTYSNLNTLAVPAPYKHYSILVVELNSGYHRLQHTDTDVRYSVLLYGLGTVSGFGFSLGLASDTEECASSPCKNGASCTENINGYRCTCLVGFDGVYCENDINECQLSPCQHDAICTDNVASYTCTCPAGYAGINCELDIDECSSSPCLNGATCKDGTNGYTCSCIAGFTGVICETDTDECADGSNNCDLNAVCTNTIGNYTCNCLEGFMGNGILCTGINECIDGSDDCDQNAACTNDVGNFKCTCKIGYTCNGTVCLDINECDSSPCINSGNCIDKVNGYVCRCIAGYEGTNCKRDIDECLSLPCQNKANCSHGIDNYTCTCLTGYEGINCEIEKDECASNPCQNNAYCTDRINGYVCTCEEEYEGINCETDTNNLLADKPSRYTVIVGAVLGFLIIVLGVYATYSTFVRWRSGTVKVKSSAVKEDQEITEEDDTGYVNATYVNMVEMRGIHVPDNHPARRKDIGTADEEEDYSNIAESRREDSKVYETIY